MTQGEELIQKLQKCTLGPKLLYFVMDDWLLVHRNSFDHFNEDGEPFISQVFLIEIKTGRYIHRCQGQKVDHGTTIDLQVLTTKLTCAFQGTKPCPGFFIQEDDGVDDGDPLSSTTTRDFPFRRQTSRNCQLYYNVPTIKSENNEDKDERCSPCQVVWHEVHSSFKKPNKKGSDFALRSDAQSTVVNLSEIKPKNNIGDKEESASANGSSGAVGKVVYSKGKKIFESQISDNDEDQASLDDRQDLDIMGVDYETCEAGEDNLRDSHEVTTNEDASHLVTQLKSSNKPSNRIFKIRQSSATGREYICMCCSQPFASLHALTRHRNFKRGQDRRSKPKDRKVSVVGPEGEGDTESGGNIETPRKTRNRCLCCSVVFPNKRELVKHGVERQKEDRARRKVGCRECGEQRVRTFKQLIQHYSIQHSEKLEKNQEYLPQTQDLETMKEPKTCSICDVVSNGVTMSIRHKESYHMVGNFSCTTCQEPCLTYYDMMIHNFQAHLKATDSIPINCNGLDTCVDEDGKISYKTDGFVCQICSKSFKGNQTCAGHQRRDHSWGRMRCKPCGEWSNYSKDISAHTLLFHKDKPEVQCPICDQLIDLKDDPAAFNSHFPTCAPKRAYKRPMNGPFQCQVCGKKYAFRLSLNAHLKMHQGIFRYLCQYCEFGANLKHTIVGHEKMHRRKMGLLTDEPEADHLRECKVCGKKLANKKAVYSHMRNVHREQKPVFQCKKCGEFFRYSAALYKHKIEVHDHVPKSKGSK